MAGAPNLHRNSKPMLSQLEEMCSWQLGSSSSRFIHQILWSIQGRTPISLECSHVTAAMKFLLSSSTTLLRRQRCPLNCTVLTRWKSSQKLHPPGSIPKPTLRPPSPPSFDSLGLEPHFVRALQKAFPDVKHPTEVQQKLIAEISGGKDVLLKDDTGSGKTFGIVLGLLNKPRIVVQDEGSHGQSSGRRVITSLLIVPHRDLAYQVFQWVERLVEQLENRPPLSAIAQVLVRGTGIPNEKLLENMRTTPPHILICTPQAFLDLYKMDKDAFGLDTLSSVVVDEVDYLIRTVASKDPSKSFRKAYEKAVKKLARHPGPTREILNIVYSKRIESLDEQDMDGEGERMDDSGLAVPQLILSSATLRVHLKNYLFGQSRWLNGSGTVKITGEKERITQRREDGESRVTHSILVVSETGVSNVEGAVARISSGWGEGEAEVVEEEEEEEYERDSGLDRRSISGFDGIALEAIATGFAVDVPSVGLVVVGEGSAVGKWVEALRAMGLDAHAVDSRQLREIGAGRRTNPTVLVASASNTRGLDLPALTHVFILGIPEGPSVNGRTVDSYVHLAGRVGRFGRPGRVITLVPPAHAPKMLRILHTIRHQPVLFEHAH